MQYIESMQGGLPGVQQNGLNTLKAVDFSGAPSVKLPAGTTSGAQVITSTSANAFTVGRQGTTNPAFNVDASVASNVTGVSITGQVVTGGVNIGTLSSGTNETMFIDSKGSGTLRLNATATGPVNVGAASNSLQVNGIIVPVYELIGDNQNQVAAASYAVSHTIFVNDNVSGTYKIAAVTATFGTTSTSGTLQVEVATGTQAIGAGTNQLTGTVSLSGTANTPVNGTIVASPTTIAAGSRVNLIFAGTVTNLANASITVALQRLS